MLYSIIFTVCYDYIEKLYWYYSENVFPISTMKLSNVKCLAQPKRVIFNLTFVSSHNLSRYWITISLIFENFKLEFKFQYILVYDVS